MMKCRINVTFDYNILNSQGMDDEILKHYIHSEIWKKIECQWRNKELDVDKWIELNQYLIEKPEKLY